MLTHSVSKLSHRNHRKISLEGTSGITLFGLCQKPAVRAACWGPCPAELFTQPQPCSGLLWRFTPPMMRNSFPRQLQLLLLQLLTVPSPPFASVHCWEGMGCGFSPTLALEGNSASSTILCLLLQANQAQLPQPLLTQKVFQTPHHFSGLHWACTRYHLALNSLFPPSSSLTVPLFFHLPCNPSIPSTFPPLGRKDTGGTTTVSSRFLSLSAFP